MRTTNDEQRRPIRRRALAVLAAFALLVGVGPAVASATTSDTPFTDIAGNTHESNIEFVWWYGIAQGVTATTYNPTGQVTRAQMATFLVRTLRVAGEELPASPPAAFPDVTGGTHALAINQLAALGIVQGNTSGLYNPNAHVTRDQMATFLVRTMEHVVGPEAAAPPSPFTDVSGNVHRANIELLYDLYIANGTTATTYSPRRTVTRAQMASFIARVLDYYEYDYGIILVPLP